jgi:exosortase
MAARWSREPQYSHGWLVPAFSLGLLWARRDRLDLSACRPSAWGLAWLAAGFALRFVGTRYYVDWFDAVSLLPCLAGLIVLAGGSPALRWSGPAIAFLIFMVPLPFRVEHALSLPLQRSATWTSAFAMQVLGLPALPEANLIRLGPRVIEVTAACNGLGMLVTFLALSTAVALASARRPAVRVLIVASAVPIALAANVARIVATGVLLETSGNRAAHVFFHDLAGWFMMPFALVLLAVELALIRWLFLPRAA